MTSENLKWAMDVLDISRRGLTKKEALVDKMCEWCMKPEKFGGSDLKSPNKKSAKTPVKSQKSEKTAKKESDSPK